MDRHHGRNEEEFGEGKAVLVFQTRMGKMHGKLRFRWTGPYWIVAAEKGTFTLGTLAGEVLPQTANGYRRKTYAGPTPPNPFIKITDPTPTDVGPPSGKSSSDEEPTM